MNVWGSCTKNSPNVWPGLAYRANPGWLGPLQEAGDSPTAVLPHRTYSPSAGPGGQSQPSDHEKITQQGKQGWGDIPTLGVGIGWGGTRVPHPNAQASASHPLLTPNDAVLPMSGSATPSKISTYNWDPAKPEQGATRWCLHTYWRKPMKEETGQSWCGWGVGWWSYIALGLTPS